MIEHCSDFFTSPFGMIEARRWRRYGLALWWMDKLYDQRLRLSGAVRRCVARADRIGRQAVLVAAVEAPGRETALRQVLAALTSTQR